MNLTDNQKRTLKELKIHDCHLIAANAETAWKNKEPYYINDHVDIPKSIYNRFTLANEEALAANNVEYQVLVHEHEYGCTTYLFPPKPKLTFDNAVEFLGHDFDDGFETIYLSEVHELSRL